MSEWRTILQFEGTAPGSPRCHRYSGPGVARPAQISIIACDDVARPHAIALYNELSSFVQSLLPGEEQCSGPRGLRCMAWQEPACQHVLVLLIGSPGPPNRYDAMAYQWVANGHANGVVITALVPPLTHKAVFGMGGYRILHECNQAVWGGSVAALKTMVLSAAMLDEKPGVFLSYVRDDASKGADAIHDALVHAGYRVFLDRFSGTPGRLFPAELAEGMSTMGLVVLLETVGTMRSPWMMKEVAFARRFRLGPIAINCKGARRVRAAVGRMSIVDDPAGPLPDATVERIVEFIRQHSVQVSVARQAHFQTLIHMAAGSRGGTATHHGGAMRIDDPRGASVGFVLASAVPGRLRHVSRLARAGATGTHILAGEHHHLSASDRDDLQWLARNAKVTLCGSGSVYGVVRRLL